MLKCFCDVEMLNTFFLLLCSAIVSFTKPQNMGVLVAEALNKVSLEKNSRFLHKSKHEKELKSELSLNRCLAVAGVSSATKCSWDFLFL